MVEARRPLLRYHGGKWRLASWIIQHFPQHRIYVEPFGGGASVLLRKPRSYAEVYNDVIENRDALEVIAQHDGPQTLHYCDPPYLPETRDPGTDYRHEMTRGDHVRLAEALHAVEGYVVLSGYHSALYDELYADWPRVERATVADGARPRVEVLWISPRTWEALAREQGYLFQEVEDGR